MPGKEKTLETFIGVIREKMPELRGALGKEEDTAITARPINKAILEEIAMPIIHEERILGHWALISYPRRSCPIMGSFLCML